jgi:hypothetical protein
LIPGCAFGKMSVINHITSFNRVVRSFSASM